MEKRFVTFIVLSTTIMLGYVLLNQLLFGPPPRRDEKKGAPVAQKGDAKADAQQAAKAEDATGEPAAAPEAEQPPAAESAPEQPAPGEPPAVDRAWTALGSMAANSPYKLFVVLDNRGAAVDRIELVERTARGRLRFRDLEDNRGDIGYLALVEERAADGPAGCRIHVVPPGSPAADAESLSPGVGPGLQPQDLLVRIDSVNIRNREDVANALRKTKPGRQVELEVARGAGTGAQRLKFRARANERPLVLIGSDAPFSNGPGPNPPSFRVSLEAASSLQAVVKVLMQDPGLANQNWEIAERSEDAVTFRFQPRTQDGAAAPLEFRKRYRLARAAGSGDGAPAYHLELDFEVQNTSETTQTLAYRLDGPNGLPTEGWWYSNKIHPSFFGAAGARDVIWNAVGLGHQLRSTRDIYEAARGEDPPKPIFTTAERAEPRQLRYAGVDTQYFCVAVLPAGLRDGQTLPADELMPVFLGDSAALDKARYKLANVSFQLYSHVRRLEAGQKLLDKTLIFAGPKDPTVLDGYGLSDVMYYGWFPYVAKPLSWLLQLFSSIVGNYGLAIIMLTVLVRACMFPLSRKAARNAAMMQELAPEMKRITEKYKNDMEKRMQAQRELYAKYSFNPLGGCLPMFVQLPIFIGLYRCLSVDIHLRQAALIPGLDWCSNLAGPDQLWRWPLPEFLAGETGWLGPYLNILPVITIALFQVQQKLFTPPATDEQMRMQQQMMQFMMIFMGILFFKVPSGLCIYFIASSVWGIAERLLLPKPKLVPASTTPAAKTAAAKSGWSWLGGNGSASRTIRKPKKR